MNHIARTEVLLIAVLSGLVTVSTHGNNNDKVINVSRNECDQ